MEIIGQAFALPLDTDRDIEIVNGAYDIYFSWLNPVEAKKAIAYKKKFPQDSKDIRGGVFVPSFLYNPTDPSADLPLCNQFFRKMFDHFSLLFTERKLGRDTEYFEKHFSLCESVLLLIEKATSQDANPEKKVSLLEEATWKRLLRLLVCDNYMHACVFVSS
jgi:hypothetical protein